MALCYFLCGLLLAIVLHWIWRCVACLSLQVQLYWAEPRRAVAHEGRDGLRWRHSNGVSAPP
jgi:hypothetical protein